MQCKIVLALIVSFLTFAVSAAPVPDSSKGLHILDREIEHAPFVGMTEVAREPEPEPENETEEARACRIAPARTHRPILLSRLHRPAMPRSFLIPGFTQPHTGAPLVSVSIVRLPFPDDTRLCRAMRGPAS
ncbi:hypothetical protein B0H13DRAFT_2354430 [Mycena leptocephala]|nr:hypothetical protein B0H13DRAFT_2354430 [Mycena leptocephala]